MKMGNYDEFIQSYKKLASLQIQQSANSQGKRPVFFCLKLFKGKKPKKKKTKEYKKQQKTNTVIHNEGYVYDWRTVTIPHPWSVTGKIKLQ